MLCVAAGEFWLQPGRDFRESIGMRLGVDQRLSPVSDFFRAYVRAEDGDATCAAENDAVKTKALLRVETQSSRGRGAGLSCKNVK